MTFVRLWRNSVTTTFLAGLVLLLPVVLTILIVAWLIDVLKAALGPGTFLGNLLTTGGTTIIGPGYDTLAFFLGIAIALIGIFVLGIIARSAAQKSMERSIDRIFAKLPIIRAIYNPVSRVVRLATDKTTGDFSGMTVVSCRFGGKNGVDVLALLANQDTYYIAGERRCMVYLPTAPLPMSGGSRARVDGLRRARPGDEGRRSAAGLFLAWRPCTRHAAQMDQRGRCAPPIDDDARAGSCGLAARISRPTGRGRIITA